MGREIKRVALDFDYPLGEVWKGYLNPYADCFTKCPKCKAGWSVWGNTLQDMWYGWILRKDIFTHADGLLRFGNREVVAKLHTLFESGWSSKALEQMDVNALWEGKRLFDFRHLEFSPDALTINEYYNNIKPFGHDSLNCHVVIVARCEWLGVSHKCEHCSGDGWIISKWDKFFYDRWEIVEPPAGEGYQLWSTTTEGSPISPVFKDEFEFSDYLIKEQGYHPEAVGRFIQSGYAPSFVMVGTDVYQDIDSHYIDPDRDDQSSDDCPPL